MLIETAMRLLAKHAEGGTVERVGQYQLRATVNGRWVDVIGWSGRGADGGVVSVVAVQSVKDVEGGWVFETPYGRQGFETLYDGPSLRDGLRAALHKHRDEDVEAGGAACRLVAEVTHGGVTLKPELHFEVNRVVVSSLQDGEAFAMAEQFIKAGEGRPLLDWLQERSAEVAAEVERVRRLAAR